MPTDPEATQPSRADIEQLITILSKAFSLDVSASLRQCEKESSFNPEAHNTVSDAYGLFQLMAPTARWLGVNRLNPAENVFGGLKYVRQLREMFDGDMAKAYAAYNWGPGNLHKLLSGAQVPALWRDSLPAETKAYVQFILNENPAGS
jgi:soluble lytic murein transglycosylase-like protein